MGSGSIQMKTLSVGSIQQLKLDQLWKLNETEGAAKALANPSLGVVFKLLLESNATKGQTLSDFTKFSSLHIRQKSAKVQ